MVDESNNPGHIVGLLNPSVNLNCVPWLKHTLYMVHVSYYFVLRDSK